MSIQNFKKGSIVPRRLGLIMATNKKAQHFLTFGVDVTWDGISLRPVNPMGYSDYLIVSSYRISAPRKNGTRQKSLIHMMPGVVSSSSSDTHAGIYSAVITKGAS